MEKLSKQPDERFLMHALGVAAKTVFTVQTRIKPYDWRQTGCSPSWSHNTAGSRTIYHNHLNDIKLFRLTSDGVPCPT